MKNTVYLGFILVILLMVVLSTFWLAQTSSSNKAVINLVKQYDSKIKYATIMSHSTRVRQLSLFSMLVINDTFQLDEEISYFYKHAAPYRAARKALLAFPLNKKETALLKEIDEFTNITLPLSNEIVVMFEDEREREQIVKSLNDVRGVQTKLFSAVDSFVALQRKRDDDALEYIEQKFDEGIYYVIAAGLFVFLLALMIAWLVARYVESKNALLQLTTEDMTSAYVKAETATALKSEFLATMSHEIRTPLTAIIGFAETTLYSNQSMEQRLNSIQTIIRSGKHLLQIINDILDLSKVEANKLEIESTEISFFELLDDIESFEHQFAKDKNINFSIIYTYPLPSKIKTDGLRVKQILINLCNNALKFTESGYVNVNVSTEGNSIIFEVIDSGVGISKEIQDVIFQAYKQADSSTTRKFGGTGLGLSLSKLLAERMGGTLSVSSTLGEGSQFKFTLPYESLPDEEMINDVSNVPEVNSRAVPVMNSDGLTGRVLLAEDNIDNQDLFMIFLERAGADVTIADNGQLAVEAVEKNDFDLILMDMRMPVMGGLEAIKLIREKGVKTPIVAVTANAMQEDKDACFNAGGDDFLTKPIDSKLLNEVLEKYLDIKVKNNHQSASNKNTSSQSTSSQNKSMISSLLEDDPNISKLVKRFVDSMTLTVKNIEELIAASDWSGLSEILHKLKGTAGNFGFPDVTALAGKMEFQAINHSQSELLILLDELKKNHKQMLSGIEEI